MAEIPIRRSFRDTTKTIARHFLTHENGALAITMVVWVVTLGALNKGGAG